MSAAQAPILPTAGAKKEEEPTILGKTITPVMLAFLSGWYDVVCFKQYKSYALMPTGNTVNMFMQIGNKDYSNTKFLLASILHYLGGMGLYKFLDLTMQGLKCTPAAAVVFGLHAVSDQMRLTIPDSRFTVLPLSLAGGFFNTLSAGKLGGIMAMMNGQYQQLTAAIATILAKGSSKDQIAAALKPLRVMIAFCLGLTSSAIVNNMNHPFTAISQRRFTFIGALYAAILLLHEVPKGK